MQPEDLDKEIDRLWAKVGSYSDAPAPGVSFEPDGLTSREITLDTIALLKRQHRAQELAWTQMLETKERSLQVHKARVQSLENELSQLRAQLKSGDDRVMSEVLEVKAKLETGARVLEEERAKSAEEERALRSILEATRARLAAEDSRWRRNQEQWEKREQQYLMDIAELQRTAARYQEQAGNAEKESHRLTDDIKEAKNALEKTLAELLQERQARVETEKERAAARKKVDEVERHFEELTKLWEEERAQWRELWDRERSTWETQRGEFSAWEENLRKEREAWHAELQAKEKNQLNFVEKVNSTLRESAETSTKLASMLKILQGLGLIKPGEKEGENKSILRHWKWAAAFCVLAAAAFPAWDYYSTPHLKLLSTQAIALDNATAMAFDGTLMWVSDWGGKLEAYDPEETSKPQRSVTPAKVSPYHPSALAFGGAYMWSLDSAQARILRHNSGTPEQVLFQRAAPGPAPTALAFDGEAVWSYDAANKAFYRHGKDEGEVKAFAVAQDMVPTAMVWLGGRLWVFDSKGRRLMIFALKDTGLVFKSEVKLGEAVVGMAASGDKLWVLAGPGTARSGGALLKFGY